MKIEILGTGCVKCKKLYELTQQAVQEVDAHAETEKVEDIKRIMNRGVMMTPALVIDGEVKVAGRIPKLEELKEWVRHREENNHK